jgi:hypothetical protein
MPNEPIGSLTLDIGCELLEMARSARADAVKSANDYDKGRQFALYEVVSLIVEQAGSFGVDLSTWGLKGVDPERELLGP